MIYDITDIVDVVAMYNDLELVGESVYIRIALIAAST